MLSVFFLFFFYVLLPPQLKLALTSVFLFLSTPATGQVVPGPQSEQRGGGLLHPRRGPGPSHAGGPH